MPRTDREARLAPHTGNEKRPLDHFPKPFAIWPFDGILAAREARWHVGRAGERGVRASSLALLAAEIVEADGAHPLDGGMCAQLELDGLYQRS